MCLTFQVLVLLLKINTCNDFVTINNENFHSDLNYFKKFNKFIFKVFLDVKNYEYHNEMIASNDFLNDILIKYLFLKN